MDADPSLLACLPAELRGSTTSIARVAAGLSGAGVFRVEAGGAAFVLKIADPSGPVDGWRRKLELQRLAAGAGLAPRIVHADEARRAVVSEFVVDRSFARLYGDPRTRDAAIALLGSTLRRVHDLPLPPDLAAQDPLELLAAVWSRLAGFAVPGFVGEAVERMRGELPPARDRPPVLGHNDVNPTNLVYDGERLLLLDWDTAGASDPFYDLAAISVFLVMDDAALRRLLGAYDGAPAGGLPARFAYQRRLVATLCGTVFLHIARHTGHPGATGDETLAATPSLAEFYQRLQTGALSIATGEGRWAFGLALIKASAAL